MTRIITREIAAKVLEIVDAGLVSGVGQPIPGQMCVEAAVCFALGLPHGDEPDCVSPALRKLKITLNDAAWSSDAARAKGMRKLAVLQLGTKDVLDDVQFTRLVSAMTIRTVVPRALRRAAELHPQAEHKAALEKAALACETPDAADAAYSAAAYSAARSARSAADAAYSAAAYSAARSARSAARSARSAADAARSARSAAYSAARSARSAAYSAYSAADAARSARSAAYSAARSARSAADAAYSADQELTAFADDVANILIGMAVPAVAFLDLIEA
jgi:hypothetical protein